MGHAAVAGVFVREEVEDTIDAVDRPKDEPRAVTWSRVDYPELVTIERQHYVIHGEIAKGGMGRVLEARDLRLGRAVAIKELLPSHRDAARRFEREARITARLQHPAIIHIYEAGVWPGGAPFYAMTKVAGRSLAQVVAERKTLEERIGLLPNVIAVADALAYAHSQDVVHRDLKPDNVLVGRFGETVVIDWGLAKDLATPEASSSQELARPPEETLSGAIVGTPAYMPPEQARGEPVDQRADVYSLGALLYKVLCGAPPYVGAGSQEVLQAVLAAAPISVDTREPATPPDLVAIVSKAMARDPAQRYPTAAELAADLKRFETGQLVAAHHYTRRQLVTRWLQRHRVAVAATTIVLVVLAVFGTIGVRRIIAERDRAETEQRKDERRRAALLEERGRTELLAGRAGIALVNLAGAVRGKPSGALGFLIAEAKRPFEAEIARLVAGEGTVLVAYHPDGTELATATADGVVTRWDAAGQRIAVVDRGHGRVRALAWSYDGTMMVTAGDDHVIRVFRRDGERFELHGHEGVVTDISFAPDSKRIVSASTDRTARIWDLERRASEAFAALEAAITVVRFAPEGQRVLVAGAAGDAEVWSPWQPDERDRHSPLRAHTAAIVAAEWSPDGTRVATSSRDGAARIWDPTTGKQTSDPILHRPDVSIDDVAWSHDGRRLITAGDQVARVWKVPDPPAGGAVPLYAQQLYELPHPEVVTARFSADDRWVVTAGDDGAARLWDAKGHPMATFEHGDALASFEMSRDGSALVTGCRDGTARILDVRRGLSRYPQDLLSSVNALAVSRDGHVAGGASDSRVWVWQPGGRAQTLKEHLGAVFAVAFSRDGTRLASAGEDDRVFVWERGSDKPLHALPVATGPVLAVAFGKNGEVIASDETGMLSIWSATGTVLAVSAAGTKIVTLAVDPSTGVIVAGSEGGVDVWSPHGERLSHEATVTGVTALAFDDSGSRLAIATKRNTVIARFANATVTPTLTLVGPMAASTAVALSADAGLVFTGGADGIARVWDATKGNLLATRDTGGAAIQALALSATSELLWTGSSDGIARALDVHALKDTSGLRQFIEQSVPWRLGEDDVVYRTK